MRVRRSSGWRRACALGLAAAFAAGGAMLLEPVEAQEAARGNPYGEWH